jgi:hypothetical protein
MMKTSKTNPSGRAQPLQTTAPNEANVKLEKMRLTMPIAHRH